jgi:hypothetical protein
MLIDGKNSLSNTIPFLRGFHIEFAKHFGRHSRDIHLDTKLNWFISSFWNKRQWFSEFVIHNDGMGYSIHSHRYVKVFILLKIHRSFFSELHGAIFVNIKKLLNILIEVFVKI